MDTRSCCVRVFIKNDTSIGNGYWKSAQLSIETILKNFRNDFFSLIKIVKMLIFYTISTLVKCLCILLFIFVCAAVLYMYLESR